MSKYITGGKSMNPFKEHYGHNVKIEKFPEVIGGTALNTVSYTLYCEDCEEEIIGDEVFK